MVICIKECLLRIFSALDIILHHPQHIKDKVDELNQNDEWMGSLDWEEEINANFEEGERITGNRAYG